MFVNGGLVGPKGSPADSAGVPNGEAVYNRLQKRSRFKLGIDKVGRAKRGSDTSFKLQGSSCWQIRKSVLTEQ